MSNSENTCFKVVIWGPPASGKASLAKALLVSLERYQEMCQTDSGLMFYIQEISDEEKRKLNFPLDTQNVFYCLGRKPANNEIMDSRVNVSAFGHFLEINFLSAGTEKPEVCSNADILILALDPMRLKEDDYFHHTNKLVDESDVQEEIDLSEFVRQSIFFRKDSILFGKIAHPEPDEKLSRAEYAGHVSKLSSSSTKVVCVEICVTNIDKLPVDDCQLEPIELLNKYFGDNMKTALRNLKGEKVYFSFPILDKTIEQGIDLGRPLLQLLQVDEKDRLSYQQSKIKRILLGGTENLNKYIPYFEDIRS